MQDVFSKAAIGKSLGSSLCGKKIVWFGTSIPAGNEATGNDYPTMVGKLLGANIINEAIGSSCLRAGYFGAKSEPDQLGLTGRWFNSIMKSMSLSSAEKQSIFDNYVTWQPLIPGAPATLTQAEVDAYKLMSYDMLLDQYLTTDTFPDLFVFDHGHNEHITVGGTTTTWGMEMHTTPPTENDRSYAIGAMNFIVHRILDFNPKVKIVFIGHYENQDKPNIALLQEKYNELWGFPFEKTWENTGWTQKTVSSKGEWIDGLWVKDSLEVATTYTMRQIWLADDTHPHSDLSGGANNYLAKIHAKWLASSAI